jgi:flagellar biosynthesis/type III secretory pathway protein FliH
METGNWFGTLCICAVMCIIVSIGVAFLIENEALKKGHSKGLKQGFEKGYHEAYRKGFLKGHQRGCEFERARVVQSPSEKETLDRIKNELIWHVASLKW